MPISARRKDESYFNSTSGSSTSNNLRDYHKSPRSPRNEKNMSKSTKAHSQGNSPRHEAAPEAVFVDSSGVKHHLPIEQSKLLESSSCDIHELLAQQEQKQQQQQQQQQKQQKQHQYQQHHQQQKQQYNNNKIKKNENEKHSISYNYELQRTPSNKTCNHELNRTPSKRSCNYEVHRTPSYKKDSHKSRIIKYLCKNRPLSHKRKIDLPTEIKSENLSKDAITQTETQREDPLHTKLTGFTENTKNDSTPTSPRSASKNQLQMSPRTGNNNELQTTPRAGSRDELQTSPRIINRRDLPASSNAASKNDLQASPTAISRKNLSPSTRATINWDLLVKEQINQNRGGGGEGGDTKSNVKQNLTVYPSEFLPPTRETINVKHLVRRNPQRYQLIEPIRYTMRNSLGNNALCAEFTKSIVNRNGILLRMIHIFLSAFMIMCFASVLFGVNVLEDIFQTVHYFTTLPVFIKRQAKQLTKIELIYKIIGSITYYFLGDVEH